MLISYLKMKYPMYLLFLLFFVIEYLIFSLAHVNTDIILYIFLFIFFILLIYFIYDYHQVKKQHYELKILKQHVNKSIEGLPQDINIIEQDYQILITKLYEQLNEIQNNDSMKYQEMIDYYTLWVHQIKTPISALKLLIQSLNVDQKMMLEVLKIEQYVNMVLQYLRLEDMYNDLSFHYYSLDKIVAEVLKKQVTFFSYQKISLEYKIDDIKILTDEKWSSFVIEQILSNAVKYTKEGYIKIYNDKEKLYIEDSGIGIKKEDLPRVFERGFTGYNGRDDKKASGIGMYLTKCILDKLGHSIDIRSELGKGTTVCIDFYKEEIFIE